MNSSGNSTGKENLEGVLLPTKGEKPKGFCRVLSDAVHSHRGDTGPKILLSSLTCCFED